MRALFMKDWPALLWSTEDLRVVSDQLRSAGKFKCYTAGGRSGTVTLEKHCRDLQFFRLLARSMRAFFFGQLNADGRLLGLHCQAFMRTARRPSQEVARRKATWRPYQL